MTFVGVQVMAGIALLLGNDASGSTRCIVSYDIEDAPRILGLNAARTEAALKSLRALCVDRDHASPQPGAFLSLEQLRYGRAA